MQPTVSVIIPTYNRASFLKESVQSVLNQTFKDFEIIIINNYSIDNTLEVICSFNDNRIKTLNFRNHGVIAKSRNHGLMNSTGKYIGFLDDDDMWCPEKLEIQIKYLESHPEFGLVYSNALIIDAKGNQRGLVLNNGRAKEGRIFQDLLNGKYIPIPTVLMKRKLLESNGLFNEESSIIAIEDYEYWVRASLKFDFGYIDKPLAMYRIHSTNVSKIHSGALLRQKVFYMLLDNCDVPENFYTKIISKIERLNFSTSVYYWSISDQINAKRCARRYIFFNFKEFRFLKVFLGIVLYIVINFNYEFFRRIVNVFENKIAKII